MEKEGGITKLELVHLGNYNNFRIPVVKSYQNFIQNMNYFHRKINKMNCELMFTYDTGI
jgi:hypothetical protein